MAYMLLNHVCEIHNISNNRQPFLFLPTEFSELFNMSCIRCSFTASSNTPQRCSSTANLAVGNVCSRYSADLVWLSLATGRSLLAPRRNFRTSFRIFCERKTSPVNSRNYTGFLHFIFFSLIYNVHVIRYYCNVTFSLFFCHAGITCTL